jgi:hypothetical protein
MKLPHRKNAHVPGEKLTEYLLSETHPIGRSKARFLRAVGFDETNIDLLEQALLQIARDEEVVEIASSPHGTKFIIDGLLTTPAGVAVGIRSIWILDVDDDRPRFVTAYPG